MQYQVFSTGDQVWTSQRDGKRTTVKMISHDGMVWEEGDKEPFRRLKGVEKFIHQVTVLCIKGVLKVLQV